MVNKDNGVPSVATEDSADHSAEINNAQDEGKPHGNKADPQGTRNATGNKTDSLNKEKSGFPVMDYDFLARGPQLRDSLFPEDWKDSTASYNKIAHKIVNIAGDQLKSQNDSKIILKEKLSGFFRIFLKLQFIVLALLIFSRMVCKVIWPNVEAISDEVIITYITSVFVETLGGIILMITYAFNSKDEVQITKVLAEVIKTFQKNPPHNHQ